MISFWKDHFTLPLHSSPFVFKSIRSSTTASASQSVHQPRKITQLVPSLPITHFFFSSYPPPPLTSTTLIAAAAACCCWDGEESTQLLQFLNKQQRPNAILAATIAHHHQSHNSRKKASAILAPLWQHCRAAGKHRNACSSTHSHQMGLVLLSGESKEGSGKRR